MENTMTMPSAAMPKSKAQAAPAETVAQKKDHWSVEFTGGMTLVNTMVSALSLWYVFLAFVALPPSV